jgi:sterol desaturase/sphingolipid hydroxylase (fatty acid hydroxylase superfamily)
MHPIPDKFQWMLLIGVPLFFCVIERVLPAASNKNTLHRWPTNFSLGLFNTLIISSVSILTPIAVAVYASINQLGLLHLWPIPAFYEVILLILVRTFIQYVYHYSLHQYAFLWRIHKVHHSDEFLDTSSSYRFHPLEPILFRLFFIPVILIAGFSAWSIAITEIIQSIGSLATHSNTRLHPRLEKAIRLFFITPTLHRYHHSKNISESNSNFGDLIVIWDMLFKTLHIPKDNSLSPDAYGVEGLQQNSVIELVEMPFRK